MVEVGEVEHTLNEKRILQAIKYVVSNIVRHNSHIIGTVIGTEIDQIF